VNTKRPVNLNLMTIKFPSTAIISILHRISGVFLFLLLPCILLALQYSLLSPQGFAKVQHVFQNPISKLVIWLLLTSLAMHFFAGIRHLLMDLGWGDKNMKQGKATAWLTMTITFILFVLIGVWLWA